MTTIAILTRWVQEEGHPIQAVSRPEGYDVLDRIQLGGVAMLLAHREGRPEWRLETRIEVQFGDHQLDQTARSKLKLHLRSVFQMRDVDYEIEDTDDGVAVALTMYLYPECLDRQQYMDKLRHMQHSGLLVSGEVDRFVVGLIG